MIMKKLCALLLLIALVPGGVAFTQDIPNGGFETWTPTTYFEEPNQYATSNSLTYLLGDTVNVTKSTDSHSGNFAARLETLALGSDTVQGLLMIGEISGQNITGGVPFNDRPDSLVGYVKYNLQGGDNLYIVCLFTRQGLPLGGIEATYSGTQNNYTRISIPIDWVIPFLTPDTLKVVIANTSDMNSGHAGSVVYVDQFQFIGTSLPFPNGGFEDWTMLSGEEPDSWTTMNYITSTSGSPYATRTNDNHSGSWAIRIQNKTSFIGQMIGFMTNGEFQGYDWSGGLAVDANPSLISGYYKYNPVSSDTALAGITTYWYDPTGDSLVQVEQKLLKLNAASTYTYFEVPLEYHASPLVDTVNITFAAGNYLGTMYEGSVLLLDDIQIEYYPVSVPENPPGEQAFHVFPNPAKDHIDMILTENDGNLVYRLFDATGKEVLSGNPGNGGTFRIDISRLESGLYILVMTGEKASITEKILIGD